MKTAILGFKTECGLLSLGIPAVTIPVPSSANRYFHRIGDRWKARYANDAISQLVYFKILSHYIYLNILLLDCDLLKGMVTFPQISQNV